MKAIFSGIAFCVMTGLTCLFAGCGPSGGMKAIDRSALVDATRIERIASLYVSPAGPQRITVEIDSVEGCEPPRTALDELGDFLRQSTFKEVRFIRKPAIARSDATGIPPEVLATRNARGAPADGNDAYLYLLFYRGETKGNSAAYVPFDYSCAIFVNMNAPSIKEWGPIESLKYGLKHEAGHVLGLCHNLSHGDGCHCRNAGCLMWEQGLTISISKWLIGSDYKSKPPTDLCADCKQDILRIKERQTPSGMEFKGPVLVRHEKRYTVYTLPCHYHINLGDTGLEWNTVLRLAREHVSAIVNHKGKYTFSWASASGLDTASKLSIVEAAEKDPCGPVRHEAKVLEQILRHGSRSSTSRPATESSPSGASTTRGQLDTNTANDRR